MIKSNKRSDQESVRPTVDETTTSVEDSTTETERGNSSEVGRTEVQDEESDNEQEKLLAGKVKVDETGTVVTESTGEVEVEETPALREYESATGERFKIKPDLLQPKPQEIKIKEKDLEDAIRGADEDVLEKIYKEMVTETAEDRTIKSKVEDTEKKLEENTHWLPLQRKQ